MSAGNDGPPDETTRATPPDDADVDALLRTLDHRPPPVTAHELIARARRQRARTARPVLRWAAGIVLALGLAGVAWAVPGSPLRAWWSDMRDRPDRAPARAPVRATGAPGTSAGVALDASRPIVLRFRAAAAGSHVRIALSDEPEVTVRAPVGSTAFTAEDGGLGIAVRRPVTVTIAIPRSAARVEVRAGDGRLFLKDGAAVSAGVTADDAGVYLFPLARE